MKFSQALKESISDYRYVKLIKSDKSYVIEPIVLVGSNYYLAKYLMSGELSGISSEGTRFNLIKGLNYESDSYEDYIAKSMMIPTGYSNSDEDTPREFYPKAVLYNGIIIIENNTHTGGDNNYYTEIHILSEYNNELNPVTIITELYKPGVPDEVDRYIFIYNKDINTSKMHELGKDYHNLETKFITTNLIDSYTEKTPIQSEEGPKLELSKYYTGYYNIFY